MSKDKQIEEMAKALCGLDRECEHCTASMSYICKAKKYAERAYTAGYRKQSEGEWSFNRPNGSYYCSCCGQGIKIKYGEKAAKCWDFCPNCGAHMKGDKTDA